MSPPFDQQGHEVADRLIIETVVSVLDDLSDGVSGKTGVLLDQFLGNEIDVLPFILLLFIGISGHTFNATTENCGPQRRSSLISRTFVCRSLGSAFRCRES